MSCFWESFSKRPFSSNTWCWSRNNFYRSLKRLCLLKKLIKCNSELVAVILNGTRFKHNLINLKADQRFTCILIFRLFKSFHVLKFRANFRKIRRVRCYQRNLKYPSNVCRIIHMQARPSMLPSITRPRKAVISQFCSKICHTDWLLGNLASVNSYD